MRKKKLLVGLLVATAFIGLASCSGKSKKDDSNSNNNNNNQQQTVETKKEYDYQAISGNFGTLTNKDDSTEKYYKFDDVVFTLDVTTQPTVTADGQITVKKTN